MAEETSTETMRLAMARDLYAEAAQEGTRKADEMGPGHSQIYGPLYWTARHAARQTAAALLGEAKRVGVSDEQWEALRAMAAVVAYD